MTEHAAWLAVDGTTVEPVGDEPYDGVSRLTIDGHNGTLVRYTFRPGARFPLHRHPQEQLTLVLDGEIVARLGVRELTLSAGDGFVARPDEVHGITAGAAGAVVVAALAPARTAAPELVVEP